MSPHVEILKNDASNDARYLKLDCSNDPLTGVELDAGSANLITTGNITIDSDASKLIIGEGQDASIYYDGTDFIFDSQEVGIGDFLFKNGDLTNPQPSGASGIEGERFGRGALDNLTTGNGNTAFGFNALTDVTNGADNVAIGSSAAANIIGGLGNVAIGTSALFNCTTGSNNFALGKTALQNNVSGGANVAVGESALQTTTGTGNIGIGASTIVTPITSNYSIMIGYAANATAANQLVIGSNNAEITQAYLGNGVTYSNPQDITLNTTGGSGTDIHGANFGLAGGKATGNAAGGSIRFQTSDAGASGTTLQTLTTKADIVGADLRIVTDNGKVILGTGQDASIQFDGGSLNIKANDITATDTINLQSDVIFDGTGTGLPYGEIYVQGNATADTIATATNSQMSRFAVDGVSNLMTPDYTNDHITVVKTGIYLATVSISFSGSGSVDWTFSLYKNDGDTEFPNVHTNRKLGSAGDIGSASMSGIVSLTADDTIELWMQHGAGVNKDITVQDCTLSLVQLGG